MSGPRRSDGRALRLLETSGTLAAIAAMAGYADQAHMTREFKEFPAWHPGTFEPLPQRRHSFKTAALPRL